MIVVAPMAAVAQYIDREAVWDKNWRTVVQLRVSGNDANCNPVRVRTGSGVIVRSNGTIITALDVVGRDEEWNELPGGVVERKVEVVGLDSNRIKRALGEASVRAIPSVDIAILNITAEGLSEADATEMRARDLATIVGILWGPDENAPQPVSGDLLPTDRGRYGDMLTVQMAVSPGHSGSGVFGADRKLVGIITNEVLRRVASHGVP